MTTKTSPASYSAVNSTCASSDVAMRWAVVGAGRSGRWQACGQGQAMARQAGQVARRERARWVA